MRKTKHFLAVGLLLLAGEALALPIDWTGSLGFDTVLINNFRRTSDDITSKTPNGTEGIESTDDSAHFQTYVFKLNPNLIVNDSVSIKGEFSTGHMRGGFAGGDSTQTQDSQGSGGSNAYFSTVPAQRSALNVNQLYAELYADTALAKVGRFSKSFGSGAILNAGEETFDRFYTLYDGVQGEIKIGNFSLIPHWARLSTYDEAASKDQPNGSRDVRELGMIAAYDNKSTNLNIALAYAKRFSEGNNTLYYSGPNVERGKTDVTLIDAYLSKKWEKFKLTLEVPMLSGEYGNVYADGTKSKISSTAALADFVWSPNVRWDVGLHGGQVGGDKGESQRFEGMQLHPNYHIAELMFRYNYPAFNEGGNNIFDSSISNARFYKLHAHYKTDKWTWNAALIMATAMQTAKDGKQAYHHEQNYRFTANENQDDNFGTELDAGFDYQWNPNVKFSGFIAYWMVGDYYAFDNDPNEKIGLDNVLGAGLRLGINF